MSKLWYTIFLAIATAKDISVIFSLEKNLIIDFLYLLFFFSLVLKLINGTLQPWVWKEGFQIVGWSAIVFIVLVLLGLNQKVLEKLDSLVCLYVWVRSMNYSQNYESRLD